jgi:hypothetical protein
MKRQKSTDPQRNTNFNKALHNRIESALGDSLMT